MVEFGCSRLQGGSALCDYHLGCMTAINGVFSGGAAHALAMHDFLRVPVSVGGSVMYNFHGGLMFWSVSVVMCLVFFFFVFDGCVECLCVFAFEDLFLSDVLVLMFSKCSF